MIKTHPVMQILNHNREVSMFHIIYPEERMVSGDRLRGWLRDAIENEEIGYSIEEMKTMSDEDVADILDREGFITLKGALKWNGLES
jgi:hypothetical protein